jgi:hypothetical protein
MTKLLVSICIAVILVLSGSVLVSGANTARIEGQLVNKTAGSSSSLAGQTVIMQVYRGTTNIDTKTAASDENGKFSFEGLDNATDLIYVVQTLFKNVHYFADQTSFAAGESLKTVSINVYDTTEQSDSISVDMSHFILSLAANTLSVKENYIFVNNSDVTFIGPLLPGSSGQRQTLKFNTPPDAKDATVTIPTTETPTIQTDGTFTDSAPVPPEGVFISYNYKLDVTQDSKTLTWSFNYDTARFDLLLDNPDIKVTSDKLKAEASLVISGKSYQDFSAVGLKKGDVISAQLSGLKAGKSGFNFAWLLLILVPIAGFAALFVARRKQARPVAVDAPTVSEETEPGQEKIKLLQEIAALDDAFENGDIEEDEYNTLRKEKKEQLLNLSKNNQGK